MTLERMAGIGAVVLLLLAVLTAALRMPYAIAVVLAVSGVGLIFGASMLAAGRGAKAFEALAALHGGAAPPQDADGKTWLGERGFSDLAGQPVSRFRVREVALSAGTVALIEGRIDVGKGQWFRASVYTAPAKVPGALCLYEAGASNRLRAKLLGGSVTTGTAIDEKFVAFGADAAAARTAAGALDADAVNGLLRRARELGARGDLAFAVGSGRACLLASDPSPALFASDAVREILETLAVSG